MNKEVKIIIQQDKIEIHNIHNHEQEVLIDEIKNTLRFLDKKIIEVR